MIGEIKIGGEVKDKINQQKIAESEFVIIDLINDESVAVYVKSAADGVATLVIEGTGIKGVVSSSEAILNNIICEA